MRKRVLGIAERRDPGHVVEELGGIGNAALRKVCGAAEAGETAADADGGQAGILDVLGAIDNAGERHSIDSGRCWRRSVRCPAR